MHEHEQVAAIDAAWAPETGFFFRLRAGHFDQHEFERVLSSLKALSFDETEAIPRRAVSVLWFIPLFMEWQVERVQAAGTDYKLYKIAISRITTEVQRLLGLP